MLDRSDVFGWQKKWSPSVFSAGTQPLSVDGCVAKLASRYVAFWFWNAPDVSGQLTSLLPSRPNPIVKTSIPAVLAAVA